MVTVIVLYFGVVISLIRGMCLSCSGGGGVGDILVGNNSLLKEKEQAQKRRELEAKQHFAQTPSARPLFGPPIQVRIIYPLQAIR
jgi:hypothetical protein